MPFCGDDPILLSGGFFRSLQFTSINTIAYAEIEPAKMSRATAMVAAAQQLSLSTGVAVGARVVETDAVAETFHDDAASDFPPAFLFVGLLSASAVFIFMRLPPDAGAELSGRKADKAN